MIAQFIAFQSCVGFAVAYLNPFQMTSRKANTQEEIRFRVMRILQDNPDLTQRELAQELGISVGGLNYCLSALIDKGFVKVSNFQQSKNKFKYVYLLTPQGIAEKIAMTSRFLMSRIDEYDALKWEIEALKAEVVKDKSINILGTRPPTYE